MRISDWSSDVCSSDLPSLTSSSPPPTGGISRSARALARAANGPGRQHGTRRGIFDQHLVERNRDDADRALLAARRLHAADRARAGNAVDAPAPANPQPLRPVECVGRDTLDGIEDALAVAGELRPPQRPPPHPPAPPPHPP